MRWNNGRLSTSRLILWVKGEIYLLHNGYIKLDTLLQKVEFFLLLCNWCDGSRKDSFPRKNSDPFVIGEKSETSETENNLGTTLWLSTQSLVSLFVSISSHFLSHFSSHGQTCYEWSQYAHGGVLKHILLIHTSCCRTFQKWDESETGSETAKSLVFTRVLKPCLTCLTFLGEKQMVIYLKE